MKKVSLKLSSAQLRAFFLFIEVGTPLIPKKGLMGNFMHGELFKIFLKLQQKIYLIKDSNSFSLSLAECLAIQQMQFYKVENMMKDNYSYELLVYRTILLNIDEQTVSL